MSAKSAAALARLGNLPIHESLNAAATGPDGALALARFIASILDRRLRSQDFLDSILPLKS
jgi:hypothetical protein